MYTINGISLADPNRGWFVLASTPIVLGTTIRRPEANIPGFDGAVEADGVEDVPALPITISTPGSQLDALRNLFRSEEMILGVAGTDRTARFNLASLSIEQDGWNEDEPEFTVKALLTLPGVWLRGAEVETDPVPLISGQPNVVSLLPGLTGKVSDQLVRVTGVVGGLRCTDTAGSWFSYSGVLMSTQILLFDAATGRAWLKTTYDWELSGTEVTQQPAFSTGPGPYPFRLTPTWTDDPGATSAVVTVTADVASASASIAFRAKPAYNL